MEPVRIKAYGFVNITKKQYLIFQGLGFLSVTLLFILGLFISLDDLFFKYFTFFLVFIVFMEIGETAFMLYKFNKKEKARLNESDSKE